jgi:tetratricopeptide (TPR) repeat protein
VQAMREEAFAVVRQLMQDFAGDTGAMVLMGRLYKWLGESDEASKWWHKCIEQNPREIKAYHGLARIAQMKGEHDKALELWQRAQQMDPTMPGVHGALAEALLEVGRPEEAAAALEKEIKISPGTGKYHFLLGQARFEQKQYEKAAQCYQKAAEIEPQSSQPYYGLASVYARLGQTDKARQCTERFQALREQEDRPSAEPTRGPDERPHMTIVLAWTHADAGDFYATHLRPKEAEKHWQRGAALDSKNRQCRQSLADLYRVSGRLAEALDMCGQLRQIDPGSAATYHLNEASLLVRMQRWDAAEESMRKAMELAPTAPAVCRRLVQLLVMRGKDLSEAKTLARKLVELEPTAPNYSLLSEVCRRCGDMDGAREAMRRAFDLDTSKPGTNRQPEEPAQGK